MLPNLHTRKRMISNALNPAKTKISTDEFRLCRKIIIVYNELIQHMYAISDNGFFVENLFLEDMRQEIKIEEENFLKSIHFFVLSIKLQRDFETLSQLNKADRAAHLHAIRNSIMNHRLPFFRYAASQPQLYWALQQVGGYHTRRKRVSKRMKELNRLCALATRRVERGSIADRLDEKYGSYGGHKTHHATVANVSIFSYRLRTLCRQLRDIREEHRMLSPLRESLAFAGSRRSELIYGVLRMQQSLASFQPTLIMLRSFVTRLRRQAPHKNYSSFSKVVDIDSRRLVEDSENDKVLPNGLKLQPTRSQAHEYIPSSQQLPRIANEFNKINEIIEPRKATKETFSHLHSDNNYDSPSLSVYSSRSAVTLRPLRPKNPLEITKNGQVVVKSDDSNADDKRGPYQAGQDTAESGQESLQFQIPNAKMQEIMLASLKGRATYWEYNLYRGPSGEQVKLHYCKNIESTERIAKLFLGQKVVGFDIEWKPQASASEGIKKNVALIQLASEERIALFHIALYAKNGLENLVAPTLKAVMESSNITKVGVSIKADCTRLRRFMSIDSQGLFELSHLYKLVKFATGDVTKINKMLVALASQVEEHLLLPMWKGEVRGSDWSNDLNYEQIRCKLQIIPYVQY